MRILISLALLGSILFASCNSNSDVETSKEDSVEVVEETYAVDKQFPEMFSYLQTQDSSFSVTKFEGGEMDTKDSLPPEKIDTNHLTPYKPYLIYNADSTKAIDLVSYNYVVSKKKGQAVLEQGGPDTEVAILNLKDNTRKRILFLGSSGTVLQAKWENGNTVAIAGAQEVEEGKLKPSIWRYNLATGKTELYQYSDVINANIQDYAEQWLKNKASHTP
ncbi:MAG TPA: hypothetical protein VFS22_10430 [Flavisolibacter sp.]|nr:hypothetical protein [Flavisolibacter sp.]